jgi:hypothetical protein
MRQQVPDLKPATFPPMTARTAMTMSAITAIAMSRVRRDERFETVGISSDMVSFCESDIASLFIL